MFWKKSFVMAMFLGLAACGGTYDEDVNTDTPVSGQAVQKLEDEVVDEVGDEGDDSLNCDWVCKCNRKCYRECHATSGSCVMDCRAGC